MLRAMNKTKLIEIYTWIRRILLIQISHRVSCANKLLINKYKFVQNYKMTLFKFKFDILLLVLKILLLLLFVNCAIALECSDGENCILHKQNGNYFFY